MNISLSPDPERKVFLIAEIGINHNGDLNTAKQLISAAHKAGFDAVKFQKRALDRVYTKEELAKPRESPWGATTREQKQGLEFGEAQFREIDTHCRSLGIQWSASAWDLESQKFLQQFKLPFNKIASARLGHRKLLEMIASEGKKTYISTGLVTLEEIDVAVEIFKKANCPFILMHTNSTYPMPEAEANLLCIPMLRQRYGCEVGYSGHEVSLIKVCVAAVSLGAVALERHITLDRTMYGSDQAASLEAPALEDFVTVMRTIPLALGDGMKRITASEKKIKEKLWRTEDL